MTTILRPTLLSLSFLFACASEPSESLELPGLEVFREVCAPYFACACEQYWYSDVASCMTYHHGEFAEAVGRAEALGLHTDLECYLSQQRPAEGGCLGRTEHQLLYPDDPAADPYGSCGDCQPVYGEQQVGQRCWRFFPAGGSDCAPGLLCSGDPGVCVDPCTPTPIGEPCEGPANCGSDAFCGWQDNICHAYAGPGESCYFNACAEGLTCQRNGDYCSEPAGLDAACDTIDCQPDLECVPFDGRSVCRPVPGRGEPCEDRCTGDLRCDTSDNICRRRGELGEACDDPYGCGEALACQSGTCAPAPGAGEPCNFVCAFRFECWDGFCRAEKPQLCME